MKVLHVVAALAPRYGGPSRNVVGICRAVRAIGVDAEVCATDADGPRGSLDVPHGRPIEWGGVPVRFFRRTFSERYKYSRELARWVIGAAADYDVLVLHGCFSHAPEAGAGAALRTGVPYVIVPHGMLSQWSLDRRRVLKRGYLRLRMERFLRAARGIVCTSAAEEAEVEALGVRAPRVRVSWGIDRGEIGDGAALRREARRRLGIADEARVVLFLGRLHPKKGLHDHLFPAVAALDGHVMLVLAGPEDPHEPGYEGILRREVERLGITHRVRFTGALYGDDKLAALDSCDVFVLPSHSENLGISVAEAMARARPVVVSHGVQMSEEVVKSGAGVAVLLRPAALAEGLARILADAAAADAMGEAGRAYVSRHMTWEAAGARFKAFYETLLHGAS